MFTSDGSTPSFTQSWPRLVCSKDARGWGAWKFLMSVLDSHLVFLEKRPHAEQEPIEAIHELQRRINLIVDLDEE